MNATFTRGFQAHVLGDTHTVAIPDEVADNQAEFNGQTITVRDHMGDQVQAILRGDLYELGASGTGDSIVELIVA